MSHLSPLNKERCMYDVTLKEAVSITGKTKRTIQRYMASGKLSFVVNDDTGAKLFDKVELLKAVGVVTQSPSDVTPVHVTRFNNTELTAKLPDNISEVIGHIITEAQKPLLDEISKLTAKVDALTNQLEQQPNPEPVKVSRVVEPRSPKEKPISPPDYLSDMPVMG